MKNSLKRLTSFLLCLAMTIPFVMTTFAVKAEDDPYADIKASIYRQLKEQNALQHYEIHVAALIPHEGGATTRATTAMRTWNAPDGGVLRYSYDWTYRGESGYVDVNATYMDKETTNAFLANSYGTYGALVMGILGAVLGKTVAGPYFTGLSIYQAANDSLTRYYIGEANGYGKVSAVYDSISGGSSVVVVGWDTYPTVELNRDDAYDISFTK